MDGVPKVTPTLIEGAGSLQAILDALRSDDSEDAIAFMEKYESVSESDLERVSVEEIFTAAGLTARRFVEVVTGSLMQRSGDITRMMVAVAQPRVTSATIMAATEKSPILDGDGEIVGYTHGDIKAQEMFHKATGFLPTPKGAQTTINLSQTNQTAQLAAGSKDDGCEPPQSADDFLMELQGVIRPKALPAPPESKMPANAPVVEYLDVEV